MIYFLLMITVLGIYIYHKRDDYRCPSVSWTWAQGIRVGICAVTVGILRGWGGNETAS